MAIFLEEPPQLPDHIVVRQFAPFEQCELSLCGIKYRSRNKRVCYANTNPL